jgi:rubrerythrin
MQLQICKEKEFRDFGTAIGSKKICAQELNTILSSTYYECAFCGSTYSEKSGERYRKCPICYSGKLQQKLFA